MPGKELATDTPRSVDGDLVIFLLLKWQTLMSDDGSGNHGAVIPMGFPACSRLLEDLGHHSDAMQGYKDNGTGGSCSRIKACMACTGQPDELDL
jgi:hypothetical protein